MGLMLRRSAGVWAGLPAVLAGAGLALAAAGLGGCASPGLPKPPSLQLPALVTDLAATRRGAVVELRFTLPNRTTDGVALKPATISGRLCRAVDAGPCQPLAGPTPQVFAAPVAGKSAIGELRDVLPPALANGPPRLLTYRVELLNSRGRSGGFSQPVFAASGAAPPAVAGFVAQGSRLGAVLTWIGDDQPGERVVLRREALQAATTAKTPPGNIVGRPGGGGASGRVAVEPDVVWLDAHADTGAAGGRSDATLDTTAAVDETYRYAAERRRQVQVSGKALELRSEMSAPVLFTLRDVFPPPSPTELSAAGFVTPASGTAPEAFAVDLIWQPVDDPHLAGYNVYREEVEAAGAAQGAKTRLNAALVKMPAFHDAAARAQAKYRYSVTAVDSKGNESPAAVTVLEPR